MELTNTINVSMELTNTINVSMELTNTINVSMNIPEDYKKLTSIAKTYDKRLGSWTNTTVGVKAIAEFARMNPTIEPIVRKEGKGGGTYAHPELAAIFKVWCDPSFAGEQQMTGRRGASP